MTLAEMLLTITLFILAIINRVPVLLAVFAGGRVKCL